MRVLLTGAWARRGLNAAILLVAVTAIAASLLGPMYGRASAEHLLDSRIEQRAPYTTGLSSWVTAFDESDLPEGSPASYRAPQAEDLVAQATDPLDIQPVNRFWQPPRAWAHDPGGRLGFGEPTFQTPLYWREGMCELAEVDGRCPQAAGEALVQATMAETLGVGAGDTVSLDYTERWLAENPDTGRMDLEQTRVVQRSFDVVGTYRISDPGSPEWFDLSRFQGIATLVPVPQAGEGGVLAAPALLVDPESMTSQTVVAGIDRSIETGAVGIDTMTEVEDAVDGYVSGAADVAAAAQTDELELTPLFDDIRAERSLLSRVTLAALAPLVVLALMLLYALVAAAAENRRPHIALARLRGHSSRQVLRFALSEPFLVVALAVPVAVVVAWLSARLLVRVWLEPGVPVAVDRVALAALVTVTAAVLFAAAAAAVALLREPLASGLASSVRPKPSTRWSLVLRSAVVAVAVASVAQLLTTTEAGSGQLLSLLTPLFVALATAVAGVLLVNLGARWWVRRTRSGRGTPAYLSARRLARRQDLTRLMVPLLLAVSVISFATSASATADDWRVSRAKADVGADRVFRTDAGPGRLLKATRTVDPEGEYVAAAVLVDDGGDDLARRVFVDTTRLEAVTAWDESWSSLSLQELEDRLTPEPAEPPTFRGSTLGVTLRDIALDTDDEQTELWVQYVDDSGEERQAKLGAVSDRSDTATLRTSVSGCRTECVLDQLYVTGSSSSVTDVQGSLTLAEATVDGARAEWQLAEPGAWRPARPFPVSPIDPPVVLEATEAGLRLDLFLGELPPGQGEPPVMVSGVARIAPDAVTEVPPVVVAEQTETAPMPTNGSGIALEYDEDVVAGVALNGQETPMRLVATVAALPELGDEGAMSDLETSLREFEPPPGMLVDTQLWAAADTPPSVLQELERHGVTLTDARSVADELAVLRSDAFSLGWRIFLLVGGATLLLAVFGVLASAVAQSRWRAYEVASLRVVGLKQRDLVRASVLEYVAMLGFAVVLGVVSAYLSLTLVLPSIDLGGAEPNAPAAQYDVHWLVLGGVGLTLFVLATGIAYLISRRVTRLGRPSTLRWAERV